MKKKNKSKRYIVIEFDGTTTRACTFRGTPVCEGEELMEQDIMDIKGYQYAEARLHPDDVYDQATGIRIALERIGFDVSDNPFASVFKVFGQRLADAVMGVQEGDKEEE